MFTVFPAKVFPAATISERPAKASAVEIVKMSSLSSYQLTSVLSDQEVVGNVYALIVRDTVKKNSNVE